MRRHFTSLALVALVALVAVAGCGEVPGGGEGVEVSGELVLESESDAGVLADERVRVELHRWDGTTIKAEVSPTGRFVATVPVGEAFGLVAWVPGMVQSESVAISSSGSGTRLAGVQVRLQRSSQITGRVIDAQGRGVGGAVVSGHVIHDSHEDSDEPSRQAGLEPQHFCETDGEGWFVLRPTLAGRRYSVILHGSIADGFATPMSLATVVGKWGIPGDAKGITIRSDVDVVYQINAAMLVVTGNPARRVQHPQVKIVCPRSTEEGVVWSDFGARGVRGNGLVFLRETVPCLRTEVIISHEGYHPFPVVIRPESRAHDFVRVELQPHE